MDDEGFGNVFGAPNNDYETQVFMDHEMRWSIDKEDPNGADNTHGTVDDDYTLSASGSTGEDLTACFGITIQNEVHTICYDDGGF